MNTPNATAARRLLRATPTAALATLDAGGAPFASYVTLATDFDGSPIFLISRLAVHTENLTRDARASLLLVDAAQTAGDPSATARLTINGTVETTDDAQVARRFLARHADAAGYADFPDFGFRRMSISNGHFVGGFGRIEGMTPSALLDDSADAGELRNAEESAVAHMNEDHREALSLYATRLLGLPDGDWRMSGADPEGIDLVAGAVTGRLDFPERVLTGGALRKTLADLAAKARATTP